MQYQHTLCVLKEAPLLSGSGLPIWKPGVRHVVEPLKILGPHSQNLWLGAGYGKGTFAGAWVYELSALK